MSIENSSWFGRIQIFKPKSGNKIGVPYEPWHHFGIIGDYVLLYIWDTREIVACYPISKLKLAGVPFTKITDSGLRLRIGKNTPKNVIPIITELVKKYPDIPIILNNEVDDISSIRKLAKEAIDNLDEIFDAQDEAEIVFVPKNYELPENMLYMFTEGETFNPERKKLVDLTSYIGRRRHFAIIARCAILNELKEYNDNRVS